MLYSHLKAIFAFLVLCLFSLVIIIHGCEKNATPVDQKNPHLSVTVEDVVVTEAWLQLNTTGITGEDSLILLRNDSAVFQMSPVQADTTIYDSTLLPAHSYNYQTVLKRKGFELTKSEMVNTTTMDTTSHEFQWESIEFSSPYGGGALYDVAIINENDIWAVGEIYSDSAQPWLPYNAVHWDGNVWELKRITYNGISWPIKAILAFSTRDVWFEAIVRWDGEKFIEIPIPNILIGYGMNKMWGIQNDNFYIVGSNGLISYHINEYWLKLDSGTELPVKDIWGVSTGSKSEIISVASTQYILNDCKVLSIVQGRVTDLTNNGLPWAISGVWFKPPHHYYIVGDGIFFSGDLNGYSKWIELVDDITGYFTDAIRGNDINDIIIVGAYGEVIHFNGYTWKSYLDETFMNGNLNRVAMKGDLVCAVGRKGDKAYILIGIHN